MRRLLVLGVCVVVLVPTMRAQSVQGQVVIRGTNRPVQSGVVLLQDEQGIEVARTTLAGGRFTIAAPTAGRFRLRLDAVGYRSTITPLFDLTSGGTLAVTLEVRHQGPITLDTVDVAGEPVPVRMVDFYQRRAGGFGDFLTRDEWERYHPGRITDVMRRMQGFTVVPNTRFGMDGDFREYLVINTRIGEYLSRFCPPLIFVDGAHAGNTSTFDLDALLAVDHLEGIEVYNGSANVPAVFNRAGADCGVISVWTLANTSTTAAMSNHLDLGWQLGARVTAEGVRHGRLGARAVIALRRWLELYPMVNVLFGGSGDLETVVGWQVFGGIRARPLGVRTPWYLGAGFTAIEISTPFDTRPSSERVYPVALTGLTLRLGALRPFVELQVLGPFRPSTSEVHVFTGLGFRVY